MMVTLYKRATPSQVRILRAVEGAVKNAADAHSCDTLPRNFARSVAKRAAGTLTAQWPEVLAARLDGPSGRADAKTCLIAQPRGAHLIKRVGRGSSQTTRRSPLPTLWKNLAAQIRPLKEAGQIERADAFVDVLKMIAALQIKAVHLPRADTGGGE